MTEPRRLRHWLETAWYAPHPPVWLLPLSWLYAGVMCLRRALYQAGILRSRHPGVPVVIVGNVAVGGTGKTPLAIWIARQLQQRGHRPGIVLRGYGGRIRGVQLVRPDDDPLLVGDEAVLLARRAGCLVAAGARRPEAAALLVKQGCDVVIGDDGLQHLALRRDCEIMLVDAVRGLGNGARLPAGPLREAPAALRRADCLVLHGERTPALPDGVPDPLRMALHPVALCAVGGTATQQPDVLLGETIHAVAGIGHPQRFFAQLRALGATVVEHAFADHHRFVLEDLQFGDDLRIVMTEKDAVKCESFAADRMWYLAVEAWLPDADAARLLRALPAVAPGGGREHA